MKTVNRAHQICLGGKKKPYTGRKDLIAIIIPLPAAALIHRFETGLEVMNRNRFERCCKDMPESRISLHAVFPPCINQKRLQNIGARQSVQDRKMLRPEVDHRHRLSVGSKDVAPETEFAGVVHGHLDEGDARAG